MRENTIVKYSKGLSARDRRELERIQKDLAKSASWWDKKELIVTLGSGHRR